MYQSAFGSVPWINRWINRRSVAYALDLLGWIAIGFLALYWIELVAGLGAHRYDAWTYWATDPLDPYRNSTLGARGAYVYSPAWVQLMEPLRHVPWETAYALWTAVYLAALAWLVGPILAAVALIVLPTAQLNILGGNVQLMMAVAVVVGMRYPAAWSYILLTKVTPGVALLWFAVRREWRSLAMALGFTSAIALASFVVAPNLWFEWVHSLASNSSVEIERTILPLPLWLRLGASAVVVLLAARRNRPAALVVAVIIAQPVVWAGAITMLLAGFRLAGWRPRWPWADLVRPQSG
jgi:hypothetical protein